MNSWLVAGARFAQKVSVRKVLFAKVQALACVLVIYIVVGSELKTVVKLAMRSRICTTTDCAWSDKPQIRLHLT